MDNISDDVLYMILPSNTDPKNKPSNFNIQLPKTVNFEKKMECAIAEIILPKPKIQFDDLYFHLVWCFRHYPEENKIEEWNFNDHKILSIKVPNEYLTDANMSKEYTYYLKSKIVELYNQYGKINLKNLINYFVTEGYIRNISEHDSNIYYLPSEIKWDILDIKNLDANSIMGWKIGYFGLKNNNEWENHFQLMWKFDSILFKLLKFYEFDYIDDTIKEFVVDSVGVRHLGDGGIDMKVTKENLKKLRQYRSKFLKSHYRVLNKVSFNVKLENIELLTKKYNGIYNIIPADIEEERVWKEYKLNLSEFNILVLSDIVKESYLNDEKVNYLGYKLSINEFNSLVIFKPLLFVPVKFDQINSISIKILDNKLNEVNLTNGITVVSLIFRMIDYI